MASSKSASLLDMKQAIMDYINNNLPKVPNNARHGIINGDRVIIGNKAYPYDVTVDMYFGEGSGVYCILPDSGNRAAIVGVG